MEKKDYVIIFLFLAIVGLSILAFQAYASSSYDVTKGETKILLLAVDPGEPRPGPGAVDMAFVLTMNEGDITNVLSVYPFQMAHPTATPPPELRSMGLDKHLLHDALWDADVEKGAKLAQEIVEANTGEKTDIVVMMTPEAVDSFLNIAGPVIIPGYGEVSGNSLTFLREAQSAGASRGAVLEALMKAVASTANDESKYLTLVNVGITQYAQGNIIVVPQGAFIQFLISTGLDPKNI